MRADRLLSIIWLLRAHGQLSTADLAERLEVSRRTIMRDIEALSTAGVPVYCERGPRGGVRLLPGYRTDVTGLTSQESRALFAAVTTWGADSLGLGDALASGLRKLLAAVPDTHREQSAEIASRVVIDPQGWLPQPERERLGETFRTVQEAVFSQHRLRLEYRPKASAGPRTAVVDPHGLVSAGSSWYLCASIDGAIQFQRISRIDRAERLPEPCGPASAVDVAAEWQRHRMEFQRSFAALTVTAWIRDSRWSDVREWAIKATEPEPVGRPPSDEGWTYFTLEFVDHLHAMAVLLRLGSDAYVVSPEGLRADLLNYVEQIMRRYQDEPGGRQADG